MANNLVATELLWGVRGINTPIIKDHFQTRCGDTTFFGKRICTWDKHAVGTSLLWRVPANFSGLKIFPSSSCFLGSSGVKPGGSVTSSVTEQVLLLLKPEECFSHTLGGQTITNTQSCVCVYQLHHRVTLLQVFQIYWYSPEVFTAACVCISEWECHCEGEGTVPGARQNQGWSG